MYIYIYNHLRRIINDIEMEFYVSNRISTFFRILFINSVILYARYQNNRRRRWRRRTSWMLKFREARAQFHRRSFTVRLHFHILKPSNGILLIFLSTFTRRESNIPRYIQRNYVQYDLFAFSLCEQTHTRVTENVKKEKKGPKTKKIIVC